MEVPVFESAATEALARILSLRRAALGYRGQVFEDDKLAVLEIGLIEYFEREGIEIE